jgi:hypothetical protein
MKRENGKWPVLFVTILRPDDPLPPAGRRNLNYGIHNMDGYEEVDSDSYVALRGKGGRAPQSGYE